MTGHAEGWAVVDDKGINVRTVSESRRAAIINWLVVEAQLHILNAHTDEQVDAMWNAHRGSATVKQVRICV